MQYRTKPPSLCRFRNRLDDLLASINEQLQSHGLMIKGATGAVIDATLIESAARPKKTITLEVDADKGPGSQRQSAVSKKAKVQERNMHSPVINRASRHCHPASVNTSAWDE